VFTLLRFSSVEQIRGEFIFDKNSSEGWSEEEWKDGWMDG